MRQVTQNFFGSVGADQLLDIGQSAVLLSDRLLSGDLPQYLKMQKSITKLCKSSERKGALNFEFKWGKRACLDITIYLV